MSFHQCTVHTLVTKLTKLSTILKPIFMVLDQSKGNPHSESFPIVHICTTCTGISLIDKGTTNEYSNMIY